MTFTKVNGKMALKMVKEKWSIKMVVSMKANGKVERNTDKEKILHLMVYIMKVIIKTELEMDMVRKSGQMVVATMANI